MRDVTNQCIKHLQSILEQHDIKFETLFGYRQVIGRMDSPGQAVEKVGESPQTRVVEEVVLVPHVQVQEVVGQIQRDKRDGSQCQICKQKFDSGNALFKHLSEKCLRGKLQRTAVNDRAHRKRWRARARNRSKANVGVTVQGGLVASAQGGTAVAQLKSNLEQRVTFVEEQIAEPADVHNQHNTTMEDRMKSLEALIGDSVDKQWKDIEALIKKHLDLNEGFSQCVKQEHHSGLEKRISFLEKKLDESLDQLGTDR